MLSRYSRIAPQLLATLEAPGLKQGFGTGVVVFPQSVLDLQVTGHRTVPSRGVTGKSFTMTPHKFPASELAAAEDAINKMDEELFNVSRSPDVLVREVVKLRVDVAVLRAAAKKLEKKKTEDQTIMLIRQLAYAIQFSLVRRFPSIFTKREWSVPYSTLRSTVKEIGTSADQQKLVEIEANFHAVGIPWHVIDTNLYYLRSLGIDESHRTGNSLSLHDTADVDISTMTDAISSAPIDEDLKDFALKALPVLRKYQVPASPLLAWK